MASESRQEVVEADKVYRRADHRGLWILAGHRLSGLDVCLYENLLDMTGAIITLKRNASKTRPYWDFRIDKLHGPFGRPNSGY